MANNNTAPNPDPNQYFYPYDEPGKQSPVNKQNLSEYGNKAHYYGVKIWPYVQQILQFFFFHIKRTIGGIITIAKDQIKQG